MSLDRTERIQIPPSADASPSSQSEASQKTVRISEDGAASPMPPETDGKAGGRAPTAPDGVQNLYSIRAKVGGGGMGVVYLALDRRLARHVALKRLNAQANANFALRRRFLNEARAVASLNHIYIVHIYTIGEDSEGPYIAMEYVSGPAATTGSRQLEDAPDLPHAPLSLDRQVAENGQYTVTEATDLIIKIAKAIAYAHAHGVIHRDLKPTNILLDATGEPKIVDFGLARVMHEAERNTVPGERLLSLGYGAPEQESDASVTDERADVYGLGGLLYFAITGQNPRYFREQDIPVPLRDVLVKALATDREQRWPSAQAFLDALEAVQSRTRIEQPPAKTTWRCKWCDTVNPLTIRFCSECGWDGAESCPECGHENFIGTQFCGKCGADIRAYENMRALAAKMGGAVEAGDFEKAILLSSGAQGFEPAGEGGRALAKELQQLRERAQKLLVRRDQLKEFIPMEMRAENFERARAFILEYRKLCGGGDPFADEMAQIPERLVKRDLKRARRALRDHEWSHALKLCDDLLAGPAPEHPDCLAMRSRILRRHALSRLIYIVGIVLVVGLLYLLAIPPLAAIYDGRDVPRAIAAFARPGARCYGDGPMLQRLLSWYGGLFHMDGLSARFARPDIVGVPDLQAAVPPALSGLRASFEAQLREIEKGSREYAAAWPAEYNVELKTLEERYREAGAYHEWQEAAAERTRFLESGQVGPSAEGESPDLQTLKERYRLQIEAARVESARGTVAAAKKYKNDLAELLRKFTKEGDMATAALVDAESKRVDELPEVKSADRKLATSGAAIAADKVTARTAKLADESQPIRSQYDEALAAIESGYAQKVEEWPTKYETALAKLLQDFQVAGDFTAWEAAKTEIDRFAIDRTLGLEDLVYEPERLAQLQRCHLELISRNRAERARAIVALADKTEAQMRELQTKLMRANNMEAAGAVNAELRRLAASHTVTAAKSELAGVTAEPAPAPAP